MPAQQLAQHLNDQQAQDTQYYRRVLHKLIDMGTDLASQIHQQALSQTEGPPPAADQSASCKTIPAADPTIAFDRISRAIRRTIALAQKLFEPVAAPAAPRQSPGHQFPGYQSRRKPKEWDGDPAKLTDAELHERIEACRAERDADDNDDDEDEDDAGRPVADIIADICHDLGIADLPDTHPGKRRIVADIAAIAVRSATMKSPQANASYEPDQPPPKFGNAFHHDHRPGSKTTDPPRQK
jgi:hypothetical protein